MQSERRSLALIQGHRKIEPSLLHGFSIVDCHFRLLFRPPEHVCCQQSGSSCFSHLQHLCFLRSTLPFGIFGCYVGSSCFQLNQRCEPSHVFEEILAPLLCFAQEGLGCFMAVSHCDGF